MVDHRSSGFRLATGFLIVGFVSGLLSAWLISLGYLLGVVFGSVIAAYLAASGFLRNTWKVILTVCASAVAYALALLTTALSEILYRLLSRPQTSHTETAVSLIALFIGGIAGACLLLGIVMQVLHPEVKGKRLTVKVLPYSLVGGVLGIIGWALGPSLSAGLRFFLHTSGFVTPTGRLQGALYQETSNWYSLLIVWQTGIAFTLGIILHKLEAKPLEEVKQP